MLKLSFMSTIAQINDREIIFLNYLKFLFLQFYFKSLLKVNKPGFMNQKTYNYH